MGTGKLAQTFKGPAADHRGKRTGLHEEELALLLTIFEGELVPMEWALES